MPLVIDAIRSFFNQIHLFLLAFATALAVWMAWRRQLIIEIYKLLLVSWPDINGQADGKSKLTTWIGYLYLA